MSVINHAVAWDEISSHLSVYRRLILERIMSAAPHDPETGVDEKSYWEHELKALSKAAEISQGK